MKDNWEYNNWNYLCVWLLTIINKPYFIFPQAYITKPWTVGGSIMLTVMHSHLPKAHSEPGKKPWVALQAKRKYVFLILVGIVSKSKEIQETKVQIH